MKRIVLLVTLIFFASNLFSQEETFKIPEGDIKTLSKEQVFDTASFLFGYSILLNAKKTPDFNPDEFLSGLESKLKDPKYGISEADSLAAQNEISLAKQENRKPSQNVLNLSSRFSGIQFAIKLQTSEIGFNIERVKKGYEFAKNDKDKTIKEEDLKNFLIEAQERAQKVIDEKNKGYADENKKWLEDNKAKEGIKTLPSGLQIQVITEGTGKLLKPDDVVKVNYTGSLINNEVFDSSKNPGRTPFETKVQGNIIQGWILGLQQMKVGGTYKLFIPSELGYGANGQGATIKPFSTLIFEMEVLEIVK